MQKIMSKLSRIVIASCAVMCLATTLFAADAVIHGVVKDSAGKPVRGAIVKAVAGNLSVSAYSQNDGGTRLPFLRGALMFRPTLMDSDLNGKR